MKLTLGAATFAATTLLMGGGFAYSLAADEPTDDTVVVEPTTDEPVTDVPEVEEPEGDDVEAEEPETEEPEADGRPGGEEAAVEHREAMAAWKDCVAAAVEAAPTATEAIDVLTLCGTKPHPPGKANGWDGEKVSKNAQKKVDKAAGVEKEHGKPDKEAKGKAHQH